MIFSIFLFGTGKSILSIKIIPKKRTKISKITLIKNFPGLLDLYFCKLHIILFLDNFKLRHICDFQYKIMKSKKNIVLVGMMGSGKSVIEKC